MSDRTLVVVVAFVFLAVFGVATGSFTQVDATRDVTIQTGEGYLGATTPSGGVENGTDVTVLTLTNRFAVPLESVGVRVIDGGAAVSNLSVPSRLGTGDTEPVTADVTCDAGDTLVEFEISVSGDSVSVTTSRTVSVECSTATQTATATATETATPTPT